jgi:hypothetical protein
VENFLPHDLTGWLKLLTEIFLITVAVAGFILRYIRKPIIEQVNGLGRRVKTLEETDATHNGSLDMLSKHDERTAFQVAAMAERMGKLEGRQDNLDGNFEAFTRGADVRFARFEEKLDSMNRNIDRLIKKLDG